MIAANYVSADALEPLRLPHYVPPPPGVPGAPAPDLVQRAATERVVDAAAGKTLEV